MSVVVESIWTWCFVCLLLSAIHHWGGGCLLWYFLPFLEAYAQFGVFLDCFVRRGEVAGGLLLEDQKDKGLPLFFVGLVTGRSTAVNSCPVSTRLLFCAHPGLLSTACISLKVPAFPWACLPCCPQAGSHPRSFLLPFFHRWNSLGRALGTSWHPDRRQAELHRMGLFWGYSAGDRPSG